MGVTSAGSASRRPARGPSGCCPLRRAAASPPRHRLAGPVPRPRRRRLVEPPGTTRSPAAAPTRSPTTSRPAVGGGPAGPGWPSGSMPRWRPGRSGAAVVLKPSPFLGVAGWLEPARARRFAGVALERPGRSVPPPRSSAARTGSSTPSAGRVGLAQPFRPIHRPRATRQPLVNQVAGRARRRRPPGSPSRSTTRTTAQPRHEPRLRLEVSRQPQAPAPERAGRELRSSLPRARGCLAMVPCRPRWTSPRPAGPGSTGMAGGRTRPASTSPLGRSDRQVGTAPTTGSPRSR